MRENFQTHGDRLAVARKLVTLRDDLDMEFEPETCRFVGLNPDGLRPHLQTLGFQNLLKRLPSEAPKHVSPLGIPSDKPKQKFDEHLFAGAGEPKAQLKVEELEPGI